MHYCDKCGREKKWPIWFWLPTSWEVCEECGRRNSCFSGSTFKLLNEKRKEGGNNDRLNASIETRDGY